MQIDLDLDYKSDEQQKLSIHKGFFEGVDKFTTMSARALISPLLREGFDLGYYLNHVRANNMANDAPYHNLYHTYCMILNVYEGACYEKLDYNEKRALIAGSLYHDYDHSAGHADDEVNIKRAKVRLRGRTRFGQRRFVDTFSV